MVHILHVGITGSLGQSFAAVYRTLGDGVKVSVLMRQDASKDPKKVESVKGFNVIPGDLNSESSLKAAVKGVDIIIATLGDSDGGYYLKQLPLIRAAKAAGVKRYIPSEFSCDLISPASVGMLGYAQKNEVRQFLQKEGGIEWTCIQANAFFEWFLPPLWNMLADVPPKKVTVYGDGDTLVCNSRQCDVAAITVKAAMDPRCANKHVKLAFPKNVMSQNQIISTYEKISGQTVEKTKVSREDAEKSMAAAYAGQGTVVEQIRWHVAMGYIYDKLSQPEAHDGQLIAHELFPDYKYCTVEDFYQETVGVKK